MNMSTRVFISYSKEDVGAATTLKTELSDLATECFLAPADLPPGQDFRIELVEQIKSCTVVLALISQNYCKSEYANQELGIALGFDKRILPICLDDTLPGAFIDGIQCICCKNASIGDQIINIFESIYSIRKLEITNTDWHINQLSNSESWAEAGHWAKKIQGADELTDAQINQIGRAVIENDQVQKSWAARPILRIILHECENALSEEIRSRLESISYI